MANQQLVDYIKSQLTAGVTKPDLQKAITAAGWTMQDSSDAFAVAEGKAPPPTGGPPPPPVQPTPAVITHNTWPLERPTGPRPDSSGNTGITSFNTPRGPIGMWALYALLVVVIIGATIWYFMPVIRALVFGGLFPQTPAPAETAPLPQQPATTGTTTEGGTFNVLITVPTTTTTTTQ